jgi:photosystem II stability/assembly factor-like uncharacterized protein
MTTSTRSTGSPALGDSLSGGRSEGDVSTVDATTDGGTTWYGEPVPEGFGSGDGLFAVSRASLTVCAAVANVDVGAAGTTDGGRTWSLEGLGVAEPMGVACTSRNVCVAVAEPVLRTVDGGISWTPEDLNVGPLFSVSCAPPATSVTVGPEGLFESRDAGLRWARTHLPVSLAAQLDAVSCANTRVCEVAGSVFFTTTDGWRTWNVRSLPAGIIQVFGLSCASTRSCEAVGWNSTFGAGVAGTTDGGKVWKAQQLPKAVTASSDAQLTSVACPSVHACTAVGTDAVVGTTNGGRSWKLETSALSQGSGLESVACASASTCQACGGVAFGALGNGAIATIDGGVTWKAQPMPDDDGGLFGPYDLDGIACPGPNRCVAVGQNGYGGGLL